MMVIGILPVMWNLELGFGHWNLFGNCFLVLGICLEFRIYSMKLSLSGFASVIFLIFILLSISCKKEDDIITDSSAKLEFSVDSVLFDTVFTTVGSITKQLKVYNKKRFIGRSINYGNNKNTK